MNIIAPSPKKPSSLYWNNQDEACQELYQILTSHSNIIEDLNIIRTNNPLPHDPIHQNIRQVSEIKRPRSFSVGDSRNYPFNTVISLVH